MLNPDLLILMPFLIVFQPIINLFTGKDGAYKPLVLGLISLIAAVAVAVARPMLGTEVPAQAILLYEKLLAGYTASKITTLLPKSVGTFVVIAAVGIAFWKVTNAVAQDVLPTAPVPGDTSLWAVIALQLIYGVGARLIGHFFPNKKPAPATA